MLTSTASDKYYSSAAATDWHEQESDSNQWYITPVARYPPVLLPRAAFLVGHFFATLPRKTPQIGASDP